MWIDDAQASRCQSDAAEGNSAGWGATVLYRANEQIDEQDRVSWAGVGWLVVGEEEERWRQGDWRET